MRFFFFNDTATTEIYTLSLHDALPIWPPHARVLRGVAPLLAEAAWAASLSRRMRPAPSLRSEEHTSELQSQSNIVCRLLLEKKTRRFSQICAGRRRSLRSTAPELRGSA